jgi:anti-sigma B factor antagonist
MLEIQSKRIEPDILVVAIAGRITMGRECKHLEWTTDSLIREAHRKVVFDLAGVTYIDSTGIGIIMMSAGQLKEVGGQLRVAGAKGHVEEVLKMTNVDKVVGLHPSIDAAAASF